MPMDDLAGFIERVKQDDELKRVIGSAEDEKLPELMVEMAAKHGLAVEADDVRAWMQPPQAANDELDEEALEAVVGGSSFSIFQQPSTGLRNIELNFGTFHPSHPQPTWPGNLPG